MSILDRFLLSKDQREIIKKINSLTEREQMQVIPPPDPDLLNKELERLHTLVRVFQEPQLKNHIEIQTWARGLIEKIHKEAFYPHIVIEPGPKNE